MSGRITCLCLVLAAGSSGFGQSVSEAAAIIRNVTKYAPTYFADLRTTPAFEDYGVVNWMLPDTDKQITLPGGACKILFSRSTSEYHYQCYFEFKSIDALKAEMDFLRKATASGSGWVIDAKQPALTRYEISEFKGTNPNWPNGQLLVGSAVAGDTPLVTFDISSGHFHGAPPGKMPKDPPMPIPDIRSFVGPWSGHYYACKDPSIDTDVDFEMTESSPGIITAMETKPKLRFEDYHYKYEGSMEGAYLVISFKFEKFEVNKTYLKFSADHKNLEGSVIDPTNGCRQVSLNKNGRH